MWEIFDTEFRASFHVLNVMYKNILKWCKDENYSFKHWTHDFQTSNFIIHVLKKYTNMKEKKIYQMSLANCDLDEVEIVLGDKFELKIEDGKYYAVRKKPVYPKTFNECCKTLYCLPDFTLCGYKHELLFNFQKLLICRDAYWKIAGEQMGLGKPWEPDCISDWITEKQISYGLYNKLKYSIINPSQFVFPTEEMRDAFYENFKDLIEQCKELL